jgi:hypothetical protein
MAEGIRSNGWKCLTNHQIKCIGVVLMIFDHLHQMFLAQGVPEWFNWLGRPVAPLFLFLSAEGFFHTRSKKRYMLQLFIGFEFMNIASMLLSYAMPSETVVLTNNIFGTLLLAAIYMWVVDLFRAGRRERQYGKIVKAVLLGLAFLVISVLSLLPLSSPAVLDSAWAIWVFRFITCIPNFFITEGGFALVLMGLLFYIFRERRLLQVLTLVVLSVLSWATTGGMQWLMVFAVIPMLLYNEMRGKGSKYFFYIFYPAHIYVLYVAAWLIS